MERYNFQSIEKKWQSIFETKKIYRDKKNPKFLKYRGKRFFFLNSY